MGKVSADEVKRFRDQTGLPMMVCKKLLDQADGDFEKARAAAAAQVKEVAMKTASRAASAGLVGAYVHHDARVGALVELSCQTDFVARNPQIQSLAREVAMQVTARQPEVVRREQLPSDNVELERRRVADEYADKPAEVREKSVEGRMKSFFEERVLLEQAWVKDDSKTIQDLLTEASAHTGENIGVVRFARFRVGETAESPGNAEST